MRLDDHPTVRRHRDRLAAGMSLEEDNAPLDAGWLRQLCLEAGADDVGFVAVDREEIAAQRMDIEAILPGTQTLISLVCRMNRDPVRSAVRSIANHEFHETYQTVNEAARHVVRALEARGIPAVNSVAAFPMEAQNFPGKNWPLSHKPVAEAAGLGKMGLHRNLIHPRFGNFVLLNTILIGRKVTEDSQPLDYSPCLDCKLCIAACPVEAIGPDGSFNFSACYSHNYREFLGGFLDWAETLADSKDKDDYRARVSEGETVSMWQSLSFKPNYKAAYCISVCPAGDDVIGPYLQDRIAYAETQVKPLQEKAETVFVLPGSDAEDLLPKRFPNKTAKQVSWNVRARDIFSFLFNITLTFQRRKARGLEATYHLNFTDAGFDATIRIANNTIAVDFGKVGEADVTIDTSSETWMSFLNKDFDMDAAIGDNRITIDGPRELLDRLGACFPAYGDL